MSPTLLLRSGIGPQDQLQHLGVETVRQSPGVGQNLSDHPALGVVCEVRDSSMIDFDRPIIQTILRYTAESSDKRNDLQIEQISFAGRPGGPPLFMLAPVLEYQYGRGQLTLSDTGTFTAQFCKIGSVRITVMQRLASCIRDTLAFTGWSLVRHDQGVTFPDLSRGSSLQDLQQLCRKFSWLWVSPLRYRK